MIECKTVADLIEALKAFPPAAPVISYAPPFAGVEVVPQDTGSVLISPTGRTVNESGR
jgi:hypothetical protein